MTNTMPPKSEMTGEDFRALLKRHDLIQSQAAEKLGVSRRTVIRWCKGEHPIDEATRLLILKRIGK
jgi:transcriptional regulator with XRE-family HTH domain